MVPVYCLTYRNAPRRQQMTQRFNTAGVIFEFVESPDAYDNEFAPPADIMEKAELLGTWKAKAWSCISGHYKILEQIATGLADVAIVCEDDILIRRDFVQVLPGVVANFKSYNLDMLLLGYLSTDAPAVASYALPLALPVFGYYRYHEHIWGTQMYMISKKHARFLLTHYGTEYAVASLLDASMTPWAADHIITKTGNRALISPQLAVERGDITDPEAVNADVHVAFHKDCHLANYNSEIHI
jgi:GR25 family glycosyltransferase involved in LPS biosynthesis